MAISIPPPLRNLCQRRGLSVPAECSPDALARLLPQIIQLVGLELRRGRLEVLKTASVIRAAVEFVPSPGIIRDERLPSLNVSPADPNQCLDSMIPQELSPCNRYSA